MGGGGSWAGSWHGAEDRPKGPRAEQCGTSGRQISWEILAMGDLWQLNLLPVPSPSLPFIRGDISYCECSNPWEQFPRIRLLIWSFRTSSLIHDLSSSLAGPWQGLDWASILLSCSTIQSDSRLLSVLTLLFWPIIAFPQPKINYQLARRILELGQQWNWSDPHYALLNPRMHISSRNHINISIKVVFITSPNYGVAVLFIFLPLLPRFVPFYPSVRRFVGLSSLFKEIVLSLEDNRAIYPFPLRCFVLFYWGGGLDIHILLWPIQLEDTSRKISNFVFIGNPVFVL